jgi:hypothetical protein
LNFGNNLISRFNKRPVALTALSIIGVIIAIFVVILTIPTINSNPETSLVSTTSGYNTNSASAQDKSNIVPLDQIVSGGPPPDGIPSIDNPKFISVQEADAKFLEDSDLVLGLNINGDIRAYPLQILVWHEIVNDQVGGTSVGVTYCPLCFTNQVFNRTIDVGQVLEFGTSGKLYNSNLVMYDRMSKSLWSQALAKGIVGKYAGVELERVPFDIAYWKEWKHLYPESKILSRDTGSNRPYGADPYDDYYTNGDVLFPVSKRDDRLGLKEIVIGFENDGHSKAYRLQEIEESKVINDHVNSRPIVLFSLYPFMARVFDPNVDGQTILQFEYNAKNNTFIDKQTQSQWNFDGMAIEGQMRGNQLIRLPFDEGFWFEWVAFHPTTELHNGY